VTSDCQNQSKQTLPMLCTHVSRNKTCTKKINSFTGAKGAMFSTIVLYNKVNRHHKLFKYLNLAELRNVLHVM